jgi:polyisoprenoid-binding protein YceI
MLTAAALVLALVPAFPAAVETYVADPAQSSVEFSVRHFFTRVSGAFRKCDVTLQFDPDNVGRGAVEASIPIASIDTQEKKRDDHLQQPEFFDASKHPVMTFKSRTWQQTADNQFDVTGDLTIKGVTKLVTLKVNLRGRDGPTARWEATTRLNRHDFGVSAFGKIIGAEVDVTIKLVTVNPAGSRPRD